MKNTNDQDQLKVALYLRVSTEEQVEKYGLDLQKTSVRAMVQSKGTLDDGRPRMVLAGDDYVYIDDISGTTNMDERPALSKLKEDILFAPEGQRPFDVVAVYKIDRFARRLKVLLDVIEFLEKQNVQFISANESIDTSTPFGKAILGIVGIIAELEIETTKARTQAGRAEAIKTGVFMGTVAPYGYTKDAEKKLVVFEKEATVVRQIFEKFVNDRLSTQLIADYLCAQEVLSPEASAVQNHKKAGEVRKKNDLYFWRAERVRNILGNEVYVGDYYFGKTKSSKPLPKEEWQLSPYHHKNIVDLYLFNQAQELLAQAKQMANTINKTAEGHVYLLSGLIKCQDCYQPQSGDSSLINWVGDRKKIKKTKGDAIYTYAYKCGRKNTKENQIICNTIPLPAEPIEEYVVNLMKQLLKNPTAVYNYQSKLQSTQLHLTHLRKQRDEIKDKLNFLPSRKQRLKEQHEGAFIDLDELRRKTSDLTAKEQALKVDLEKVEYLIAQSSLSVGYINTLRLFSPKYVKALDDMYQKRQEISDILHMLISSITVFSRPLTDKDKIAGRKRNNQHIPFKIEIELKLPRDIFSGFAAGFGVKTSNL